MKYKKLKVGIAGFGRVGKIRLKVINKNSHLKIVGIGDKLFKKKVELKNGIYHFKDFKELLKQDIDILFVCLPNKYAPEACILALKNNIHVFCEKPPGRSVKDILRVIAAEKRRPNLKLKYGFNHRYHESIKEAKKIIHSKKYGEIINFRGVYGKSVIIPFTGEWRSKRSEAGGGILLDQGIHMLDMLLYFSGTFNQVSSFVSNSYWKHDVEDNVYAIMKDTKGRVAMIHSTATEWQHKFRLEITLERALIELSGILSSTKSYGDEKFKLIIKENRLSKAYKLIEKKFRRDNSWKLEVDEFTDIIRYNRKVLNGNSNDALKVMQLIKKIYNTDNKWKKNFNFE